MIVEWLTSPAARRVLQHWGDTRPAWLWSADGTTLLWRNDSARFFEARLKKGSLRLATRVEPLKGQVGRLIRLGSLGRASLSRLQLLADGRPVSATCAVTPLPLEDASIGLLAVAIDPIDAELLAAARPGQDSETLLPAGSQYLYIDDGQIRSGTPHALEAYAPQIESEGLPPLRDGAGHLEIGGIALELLTFEASPHGATLVLFAGAEVPQHVRRRIDEMRADDGLAGTDLLEVEPPAEPLLPIDLPEAEATSPAAKASQPAATLDEHWVEPFEPRPDVPGLANLFDRLADDEGLYAPLTESDDTFAGPLHENVGYVPPDAPLVSSVEPDALEAPASESVPSEDVIAAVIAYAEDELDLPVTPLPAAPTEPVEAEPEAPPRIWKVTGRGFMPIAEEPPAPEHEAPEPVLEERPAESGDVPPSPAEVEQVSRYNFDVLSRILADRVGLEAAGAGTALVEPPPRDDSTLVSLSGDTFVLNRLPIGIMVFRDQQILFANRALTELLDYNSIEALRQAGLAAIFPSAEPAGAGPVTQLLRRDGAPVPVRARLQSVPWQGRQALMLSALAGEEPRSHEGTVVHFAALAADVHEEGFVRTDRAAVITEVSLHARRVLGLSETDLIERPLSDIVERDELALLRDFLEQPARFAETSRPSLHVRLSGGKAELLLFVEGQAGVVSGYFGFVRALQQAQRPAERSPDSEELEPSMLGRLSRGIRRPLNTIIGFADLISSAAFGEIVNQRYLDYARDIKAAGGEIAALVDELDDYARLREGRYAARPAELDLAALLESCVVRVRGQASAGRVLVRSAISERLPKIRADRASLGQAVLNLLASAIDQSPPGASVILSARSRRMAASPSMSATVPSAPSIWASASWCFVTAWARMARRWRRCAPASGWRSPALCWLSTPAGSRSTQAAASGCASR